MPDYFIHDNGRRPYKVTIDNNLNVNIYKNKSEDEYEDKVFKSYKPQKIFIGKSPKNNMTKFSGEYGKKFDGNSILLQFIKNSYTYIGSDIFSFKTDSEIINYVSPIGNNNVPYPYAIDTNDYYYLMIEKIKIRVPKSYDCYNYYYYAQLLTPDLAFKKYPIFYSGILEFKINNQIYTLTYTPEPVLDFKRIQKNIGKNISIKMNDGKIIKLTVKSYKKIMDDFNEKLQAIKFA